jgi:hypothetical protein
MKFPGFRELRNNGDLSVKDVIKYLSVDLIYILRELTNGLTKLDFSDNFQSFSVAVEIAAASELQIRNELDLIPTKWVIMDNIVGGANIERGDSEWTLDWIYLKNVGGSTCQATVTFFK